ncbi:MAG: hypothetical protein DMD79_16990 [Candidatus Rokuibacteriota bacterium]|nr:MAG: hypothetical protein DMD79_16990 [Candidatus Rokubacteria bacterium]
MAVALFVMVVGAALGLVALASGPSVAAVFVLLAAFVAAGFDAAGLLWPSLTSPWGPRGPSDADARPASGGSSDTGIPAPVLWRIVRDTFEISMVTIALVAGLTYAVLRAFALSAHLLSG